MPLKKDVPKQEPNSSRQQGEPETRKPALAEPAAFRDVEHGRPYQTFVESRLKQYLPDENLYSLVKPTYEEVRVAAMPILCNARRRRNGGSPLNRAHRAVANVVQHAREERWTDRSLSDPYASPDYVEALIQLADDADWLAREIQVPGHSPMYYTRDARTGLPVPRNDSYIRCDYLSEVFGSRLPKNSRIYPRTSTHRGYVSYTLQDCGATSAVRIHYIRDEGRGWEDLSGVKHYDVTLESLRSANMRIASIKASGLGWQERERQIYEIRARFGLH